MKTRPLTNLMVCMVLLSVCGFVGAAFGHDQTGLLFGCIACIGWLCGSD